MSTEIHCSYCSRAMSEYDIRNGYKLVTGWERVSRGGAGGTNALRLREPVEGRYACKMCVDRAAKKIAPTQGALL